MNCDDYKKKIMDYIDNQLNAEDREKFEIELKSNLELKNELSKITNLLKSLKSLPGIKADRNFMISLNQKIDDYEMRRSNSFINYIKRSLSLINLKPTSNTILAKASLGAVSILFISLMSYFAFNTNVGNQPLMLSNSTIMNDSLEYAVGVDTTIYDTIKLIK
tara:strand:+ start:80 stop:568 length:489 start_codon:yes stop_codon:yes gene_type:complete